MSVSCTECNEQVRKECYVTHIKKNHPMFFWNDIVAFHPDNTLKSKTVMKEVLQILSGEPIAYFLGSATEGKGECNEMYIDFSTGTIYNKETTAIKHIIDGKQKHSLKLFDILKESLTPELLVSIFQYSLQKPVEKIMDPYIIAKKDEEITILKKELENLKTIHANLREDYKELKEESYLKKLEKEKEQLTIKNYQLDDTINTLYNKIDEQEKQLRYYKQQDENKVINRQQGLDKEIQEWSLIEKMEKKTQKEIDKIKAEKDKIIQSYEEKIKKLRDNMEQEAKEIQEQYNKKLEKKEEELKKDLKESKKKYKKQIEKNEVQINKVKMENEALKFQIKQLKKKDSDSDSEVHGESDSDSSSDSD